MYCANGLSPYLHLFLVFQCIVCGYINHYTNGPCFHENIFHVLCLGHFLTIIFLSHYVVECGRRVLLQSPLIYCHFASGRADPCYKPVKGEEPLRNLFEEFLESYNEVRASTNLVLFEGAMQHV